MSYAYFEANPATAMLERRYTVLRLLDIEISLNHTSPASGKDADKTSRAVELGKTTPSAIPPAGKKES